jgi:hypothetical protein
VFYFSVLSIKLDLFKDACSIVISFSLYLCLSVHLFLTRTILRRPADLNPPLPHPPPKKYLYLVPILTGSENLFHQKLFNFLPPIHIRMVEIYLFILIFWGRHQVNVAAKKNDILKKKNILSPLIHFKHKKIVAKKAEVFVSGHHILLI